MLHDGKVVRDEEVRKIQLLLQFGEQVQHASSHAHVKCRHGFVERDDFRVQGQRTRDGDALTLTAGELARVPACVVSLQSDELEQFQHALILFGFRHTEVVERLGDRVADRQARVERRERILEDDLQVFAHFKSLLLRKFGDVTTEHGDRAGLRGDHVQNFEQRGGLAAAGLADECQAATLTQREVDSVDGEYRTDATSQY